VEGGRVAEGNLLKITEGGRTMKREIRISRSFVSSVTSGRSIFLTMLFLLFQTAAVLMFWNSGFSDPLFNSRLDFPAGDGPYEVAVGDMDGDNALDLAVVNRYSNDVSVLLGNGDGTFQSQQRYAVGDEPRFLAIGDLDGDGVLDLAVGNSQSGDVSVLLGNGDGTFQSQQRYATGYNTRAVAVGDLDGDSVLDLVVVAYTSSSDDNLCVLLGNGDGTFQSEQRYQAGDGGDEVAVGDLDGDGALDVAVANFVTDNVSVLLGNGDGTFQSLQTYAVGDGPESIAIGDLDGDGVLDLAVANYYNRWGDDVSVLLGNGDGTFQSQQMYTAGWDAAYIEIGDLDGDGAPDLAVANVASDDVSVLLGNGDGTFQSEQRYETGPSPASMAIGDLDGDGVLDLAVPDRVWDEVSVFVKAYFCVDLDGDEYGVYNTEICPIEELDCDDRNPDVNPGASEICDNGIDDDCDGAIDYPDSDCPCLDNDGDGYGQVANINCTYAELDCDDTDPDVNPGATEICDNGIDDDCDHVIDYPDSDCPCLDNDSDGYGQVANVNCTYPEVDCDDTDPDVNPGAAEGPPGDPTCSDTADNDCDSLTDLADPSCVPCVDNDGDGYGVSASINCTHPKLDCDDTNPDIHPDAYEDCTNGIDDNCNGQTDADDGFCSPKSGQAVTLDSVGDVGRHSVLDLDTADHVHIAYYDVTDQKIKYVTNASGVWMHEVVATGLTFNSEFPSVLSIAADSTGAVHIAYHDRTNEVIRHATNASGTWIISAVESAGCPPDWSISTGIAVDSMDNVHMVYPLQVGLKYADNASGSWQISTIDPYGIATASIDLDNNDKVHISYSYGDTLMYASNASGAWQPVLLDGPHIYFTAMYNSIAVDSSNHAHISYEGIYREGMGAFRQDLLYATAASGSWELSLLAGGMDYFWIGSYNSIAVDSTDATHVSYVRILDDLFFGGPLKYATNRGGTWTFSSIRSGLSPETARDTSIAVDSSDRAHICYYDPNEGDLKYVMISSGSGSAWGTASVVGSPSTSDALNYLLCLLVPIGAVLVWAGMRRRR